MAPELEVMTWDDLGIGSRALAEAVHADDWIPDLVLGISRGGLLVAGALAYALGVKNTATISVEFYTGVDERLELPMLLPPVPARHRRPRRVAVVLGRRRSQLRRLQLVSHARSQSFLGGGRPYTTKVGMDPARGARGIDDTVDEGKIQECVGGHLSAQRAVPA